MKKLSNFSQNHVRGTPSAVLDEGNQLGYFLLNRWNDKIKNYLVTVDLKTGDVKASNYLPFLDNSATYLFNFGLTQ